MIIRCVCVRANHPRVRALLYITRGRYFEWCVAGWFLRVLVIDVVNAARPVSREQQLSRAQFRNPLINCQTIKPATKAHNSQSNNQTTTTATKPQPITNTKPTMPCTQFVTRLAEPRPPTQLHFNAPSQSERAQPLSRAQQTHPAMHKLHSHQPKQSTTQTISNTHYITKPLQTNFTIH